TDSAGLFFGLLSLWLCLRIAEEPSTRHVVLAGVGIGVATATRYFMAALAPLVMASVLLSVIQRRSSTRRSLAQLVGAGVAAPLAFALASPYALFDFSALQSSLRNEMKPAHPGADGFSPMGTFGWYVHGAFADDLPCPIVFLAAVGPLSAIGSRGLGRLLPLGYIALVLIAISAPPQHWHRWIIP